MKTNRSFKLLLIAVYIGCIYFSCNNSKKETLFGKLEKSQSGIDFINKVNDSDSSNSFINEFGYMGGGVGIGDFNNDGLKDIVFTANQTSCRIYINKGDLKFEDITEKAGLQTNVWATGVSIVDINGDGYDDIYICTYGENLATRSPNLLFINQQNLTFKEEASAYGLADTAYSSQAAFFDYDRDGDLDMYLCNYSFNSSNTSANNIVLIDTSGKSIANDRLYRNEGYTAALGHPVFVNVSMEAGIKEDGYGLGVTITDINNDNWPDIYVANDFISNDRLWLNQKDGTFKNIADKAMRHQSYSSMGVDAGDLNNDGLQDVVTLDMLPEWNERKKIAFSFMNYDRYQSERRSGYSPEFMRNMLQLNNGNRPFGEGDMPYFSEIGQYSGIAATDWSWSVLLVDLNLDGYKDMHITNGIGRDFINADFVEFSSQMVTSNLTKQEQEQKIKEKLASLNNVRLPNYCYLNDHNLNFKDISKEAGVDEPSMSNGAAYADLDNDGDLDLVTNNINDPAFVWINQTLKQSEQGDSLHYLKIKLKGLEPNGHGIGAHISIYQDDKIQSVEQQVVRGYYSSVDVDPVFGLGKNAKIDSLIIVWPNEARQRIINPVADTVLLIDQRLADKQSTGTPANPSNLLFDNYHDTAINAFVAWESEFNDFATQRMLPQKFSQLGPFIATADVNGDSLTDFFVGGQSFTNGTLFLQDKTGHFKRSEIKSSGRADQLNCLFFDVDGDNDPDLVISYGDLQATAASAEHIPRLFLNDGKGNFTEKLEAFPDAVACIAGTLSANDFDGDGALDLFLGGRVSDKYPAIPQSFLLKNVKGVFVDVTKEVAPELQQAGMLTSSVWMDFDGDHIKDLIVAGEWMPVRFFRNENGKLIEKKGIVDSENMSGMWRSLTAADIDNDGDMDLIAGNLGQNCLYKASANTPMELHAADLDKNGIIDPVMFYYIRNKQGERISYPAISRAQFADQVPLIKKKFLYAKDYGQATFKDIFSGVDKENVLSFTCTETSSCILENLGNSKFSKRVLPAPAQFSPINSILCEDFDHDGIKDLLLAGNEYQTEVMGGRYDASYGCFLNGGKNNNFKFVPGRASGVFMDGDIKDMATIQLSSGKLLVVGTSNGNRLQVLSVR